MPFDWDTPCTWQPEVVLAADVLYDGGGASSLAASPPDKQMKTDRVPAGSIHALVKLLQQLVQSATAYIAATVRSAATFDMFVDLCNTNSLLVTNVSHELRPYFLFLSQGHGGAEVKLLRVCKADSFGPGQPNSS